MSDALQASGAVAGFIALALSILLSLRALGVFARPAYTIISSYLRPHDIVGFPTMPHFVLSYRNVGNVPVTFSDFELKYPRLDAVDASGGFTLTTGARLHIDKRLSSRVGGVQEYEVIDYRTNMVELAPGASHTDFFDLGALLGWEGEERDPDAYSLMPMAQRNVPENFHPSVSGAIAERPSPPPPSPRRSRIL